MSAQLELAWRDPESLWRELEERSGLRLQLVMTDNASTVMRVRRDARTGRTILRMHHMFLRAEPRVLAALAVWIQHPRRKAPGAILDEFIREHRHLLRASSRRMVVFRTRGECHDLSALYDEVNEEHFGGQVKAHITWGKRATTKRRRSIRFGSYTPEDGIIRIHPSLDQPFVPRFFVRYIVFHEMLHAFLGIERSASGRRQVHSREFKRMEREYPGFKAAEEWQADPGNLRRLLRS